MQGASYRYAIETVARNDQPLVTDVDLIAAQITVQLLADIFDVSAETIAVDVAAFRNKLFWESSL